MVPDLLPDLLPDCDPEGAPEPAVPRPDASAAWAAPPDLVAWTADGELAVVDGASGVIRQTLPARGGTGERDVAWDRWARRILVAQLDEGGEGGEIGSHLVLPGRTGWWLGDHAHEAWVDGRVRLLPAPTGTVLFEESYGERWRLLGAAPTPSVSAPPPASAWLALRSEGRPGGAVIQALTVGAEGALLERRAATVGPQGIAPPTVQPISAGPTSAPPSARLVPAPALGDAVLVDVSGASLVVRLLDGGAAEAASLMPLPAAGMRIEAAVALHGGAVVALLMSGAPGVAGVTAIAVDPSGVAWSVSHLPLPGDVAPATRFFSRDLATQGPHRVLAATGAGVHAVQVEYDDLGVSLSLVPEFVGAALRGPLAVVDTSP